MIILLVYITTYCVLTKKYIIGGFFFGLSVHFKIYPIIYAVPLYLFIDMNKEQVLHGYKMKALTSNFFTLNRLSFTVVSALTFLSLTAFFY